MSNGGVCADDESIAQLERAVGRFANRSLEIVAVVAQATRRIAETLEERRGNLQRKIARLEQELAELEDGGGAAHLQARINEACEALARARSHQREFEAATERYRREALSLERLGTETTAKARAHLRALGDDLLAYRALRSDAPNGRAVSSAEPTARAGGSPVRFDPTPFRLPKGFRWVAIGEIDPAELSAMNAGAGFLKTSAAVMRQGVERLRSSVLPAISDAVRLADSDEFARRDAARGASYEDGDQRVFDAFFGADPIRLDRAGRDKLYAVIDGRHRIACAADAGWEAVPARANDGESP